MDIHRSKCGRLGKGTPGSRLKAAWKRNVDFWPGKPLRQFARDTIRNAELIGLSDVAVDAANWLGSK